LYLERPCRRVHYSCNSRLVWVSALSF
jgi:hypothetical protein